jgi:glycosyltransferase involved in cell wall biosynthesis
MRIAVYHNLHSGGAKRVVSEQINYLAKFHQLTLFSLSTADQSFATIQTDITEKIINFTPLSPPRRPFGRFHTITGMVNLVKLDKIARQTAKIIDETGFEVVLVHPCQFTQAPLLLRYLKTPSLYYCHELPRRFYEPEISRPYRNNKSRQERLDKIDPLLKIIRFAQKKVDKVSALSATTLVTNSKYTRSNIYREYKRKAEICLPGVFIPKAPENINEREKFVLSVGALTPNKGFDLVITALGVIPQIHRPNLVIVSNYQDAAEREFLQNLAHEKQVKVSFLVNIPDTELQALYKRAACVAYAPVCEPFGLVALEAMVNGAPLVGVAEGGLVETIIDGQTGILTPRQPDKFAQAILKMLNESSFAEQLARNAYSHILKNFAWQNHFAGLKKLLDLTLGERAVLTVASPLMGES